MLSLTSKNVCYDCTRLAFSNTQNTGKYYKDLLALITKNFMALGACFIVYILSYRRNQIFFFLTIIAQEQKIQFIESLPANKHFLGGKT